MNNYKLARELLTARNLIAKKRPETYIEGLIYDIKESGKDYVKQQSEKALSQIKKVLKKFVESKGIEVVSIEPSLGSFRGHTYVSTCKLVVRTSPQKAKALLPELIQKFSHKFKFKGQQDDGTFKYNLR